MKLNITGLMVLTVLTVLVCSLACPNICYMCINSHCCIPDSYANDTNCLDCLNEGSGPRSCFQSPQLFYNKAQNFNILEKGVNTDNANLIIREDFSMPMNLDPKARYEPILFMNAPKGNLDKPLDQQSNESIDLSAEELSLCRNCKVAVCKDDYCSLQNALFM